MRDTKCSRTRSGGRFRTTPVVTAITRTPDAPNPANPLTMSRMEVRVSPVSVSGAPLRRRPFVTVTHDIRPRGVHAEIDDPRGALGGHAPC
jgi:hypothetical protein